MNTLAAVIGLFGAIYLTYYAFVTMESNILGIAMLGVTLLSVVGLYGATETDRGKRRIPREEDYE